MKGTIVLPQELNINSVTNALELSKEILSKEDEIILDAGEVEIIDALGLQIIFAIQKTALLNNVKFNIINAKPALQKYMSYL